MENMSDIIASEKNMRKLDYLIKKIFSNFVIKGKKVEKSRLNSPFDAFADLKNLKGAR